MAVSGSNVQVLDGSFLAVRYGATPRDWEEATREGRFVELIDGRLIVHSPAGLAHQRLLGFLHHMLARYVEDHALGEVLTGPFTMDLSLERKFEPDLVFLTTRRVANLTEDRLVGPADLAIEIASPSTRGYDRGEKRECYRVAGVGEYWIIDPISKGVSLDRPAGYEVGTYSEGWVESQACPGFAIRAEWLWRTPLPAAGASLDALKGRDPG